MFQAIVNTKQNPKDNWYEFVEYSAPHKSAPLRNLEGEYGAGRRSEQHERIALLNTGISFFARSLMAKPCSLLML